MIKSPIEPITNNNYQLHDAKYSVCSPGTRGFTENRSTVAGAALFTTCKEHHCQLGAHRPEHHHLLNQGHHHFLGYHRQRHHHITKQKIFISNHFPRPVVPASREGRRRRRRQICNSIPAFFPIRFYGIWKIFPFSCLVSGWEIIRSAIQTDCLST